jgi:hypothetical protein
MKRIKVTYILGCPVIELQKKFLFFWVTIREGKFRETLQDFKNEFPGIPIKSRTIVHF